MKLKKQYVIQAAVLAGAALVLSAAWLYMTVFVPAKALSDPQWYARTTPEQRAKMAHKVLRYPVGNHHDAFLILMKDGTEESIPYLLSGLKWYEFFNKDDDFVACTKDHCLEALRTITQKDLGSSYADWKGFVIEKKGR